MNIRLKTWLSFFVVLAISASTMIAAYPKIYSPYSFTVVIPAFVFYALALPSMLLAVFASLPNSLLFLLISSATEKI